MDISVTGKRVYIMVYGHIPHARVFPLHFSGTRTFCSLRDVLQNTNIGVGNNEINSTHLLSYPG